MIGCIILLNISFNAQASGVSAGEFSQFMFVFFSIAAFIVSRIANHYIKKMKSEIYARIIRVLSISLFISPVFYVEHEAGVLLPSAVALQISGGRLNAFISILVTSLFMYFYMSNNDKIKKEKQSNEL